MARPSARLDFSFELNIFTGYEKAELSSAFSYLKVSELLNFLPDNENTLPVQAHSDRLTQTASKPVNAYQAGNSFYNKGLIAQLISKDLIDRPISIIEAKGPALYLWVASKPSAEELNMLHPDFKNGQKVDLHTALSMFVVMMGFLFYIDAAPGTHSVIALSTILFGFAWYAGHKFYNHWHQAHHSHPAHRPRH